MGTWTVEVIEQTVAEFEIEAESQADADEQALAMVESGDVMERLYRQTSYSTELMSVTPYGSRGLF